MIRITPEYQEQQRLMHQSHYGGANQQEYYPTVLDNAQRSGARDLLDYGSGKGFLGEYLYIHGWRGGYYPYDPGIPEWAEAPRPADFVACLDVLEHVEPHLIEDVLDDLKQLMRKRGALLVCHREALKTLPDGRNAHLIVKPPQWWHKRLAKRFKVVAMQEAKAAKDNELLSTLYHVEPRS